MAAAKASHGLRASPSTPAPTAGQKRKRVAEKKFYAVKQGKTPGIYDTWQECLNQVRGQKGALFKAFSSLHEAQAFIDGKVLESTSAQQSGEQKFYAVQNGRVPGVYTDWSAAQEQIRGFRNPKHKKFTTRAEAEAFVVAGKKTSAYDAPQTLAPDEEIRRLIAKRSAPGLVLDGEYLPKDKQGLPYEFGRGPLPPGAEDGYDPNIKLGEDGKIVARTQEEKQKTKTVPTEREPLGMLRIYTDGSSLRNGQAGARAGVGVYFGPQDPKYDTPTSSKPPSPHYSLSSTTDTPLSSSPPPSSLPRTISTVYTIDWQARGAPPSAKRPKLTWRYRNVSEALKGSKQTNQRAELTAILRALDIAPRHRDVTIYTDSKYSIDCVTNWFKNWESNGWVNAKGKPVENRDLVQDVREKIEERQILGRGTYFVWVKGHANDAGNIAADRLANEGALMGRGADEDDTETGSERPRQDSVDTEDLERGTGRGNTGDGDSTVDDIDEFLDVEDDETRESFRLMMEARRESFRLMMEARREDGGY